MRTNNSGVTEVAHVRSYGSKAYEENYERIFGKKKDQEELSEEEKEVEALAYKIAMEAVDRKLIEAVKKEMEKSEEN